MDRRRAVFFLVLVGLVSGRASAATISTVLIGNPGNAGELSGESAGALGYGPDAIVGAVPYNFRMGKYEVTNTEYAEFLEWKAKSDPLFLYDLNMGNDAQGGIMRSGTNGNYQYSVKPGMENKPVVYVNWYDAIRFANWLHNGQGSGDTETGAYTILGGTALPFDGLSIVRNPGAKWYLPNEDEWYKAAYYQPADQGGDSDSYWLFAMRTNTEPYSDQPPGIDAPLQALAMNFYTNDFTANGYNDGYAVTASPTFISDTVYLTDVGAYTESYSFYGTFDQGGNVQEWNETLINYRGMRGGAWAFGPGQSAAWIRIPGANPTSAASTVGFRVAALPEPSTWLLAAVAFSMAALWKLWRVWLPRAQ